MMEDPARERLRRLCLAFPEAREQWTWGDPTYRVGRRIFAMEKRGDGRTSVWCKAPQGNAPVLVAQAPQRYFVPPYVGHRGWIGMRLDRDPDWDEVAQVLRRSYLLIAPVRLARLLGDGG